MDLLSKKLEKTMCFGKKNLRKRLPIRRFDSFSRPHAGYFNPQKQRLQYFFNEMLNDLA